MDLWVALNRGIQLEHILGVTFGHFFVIFANFFCIFVAVLWLFLAIYGPFACFLGIFSGIQNRVWLVALIGE